MIEAKNNRDFLLNDCRIVEPKAFDDALEAIVTALQAGGRIYVCGNGGSASDAEHIVGELGKSFEMDRPIDSRLLEALSQFGKKGALLSKKLEAGIPAFSLNSQISLISAIGNDIGFPYVFAQQIATYGRAGDVLICISTSGNSENVVLAAITAKAKALSVVSLTGRDGGELRSLSDYCIRVGLIRTAAIQEKHIMIYHLLCREIESRCLS